MIWKILRTLKSIWKESNDMGHCNLRMDDDCYGCPYYGLGDIDGCKLTIKFLKKFPNGNDKQYEQYMLSNGRIKIQ